MLRLALFRPINDSDDVLFIGGTKELQYISDNCGVDLTHLYGQHTFSVKEINSIIAKYVLLRVRWLCEVSLVRVVGLTHSHSSAGLIDFNDECGL